MSTSSLTDPHPLQRDQLDALNDLLRQLARSNRFYRPVLQGAGVAAGATSLDEFRARVPFTTKQQIAEDQESNPPYGTNLTFPLAQYSRFHQTSATSGRPIRWLDTSESWQGLLENWKRVYRAAGIGSGNRLYFAFSFGPFLGFWTAFEAASQLGCLCIPGGGLGSLGRLEAMRANQVDVLLCTPTYAGRLAEVAAAEGFDPGQLAVRKIIVAGEPGGSVPEVRRDLGRRWPGAQLFDHHGMTEVGPVSYQCPQKPGTLMVIGSAYLAEIVDPATGRPVEPGETGELVLTTLRRIASPLIRYRTGDLVREDVALHEDVRAGEMPLAGGILGRVDDMVVVRGVNVYPSAVDAIMRCLPGVAEYRVALRQSRGMTEMQIEVEPSADVPSRTGLAREVAAQLRAALNLRVPVTLCGPESLPRFEMKARRWIRQPNTEGPTMDSETDKGARTNV
ncbi:MAG: phenylacetate--CoA ligase family protein [Thermoguttaceae bacterium]